MAPLVKGHSTGLRELTISREDLVESISVPSIRWGTTRVTSATCMGTPLQEHEFIDIYVIN